MNLIYIPIEFNQIIENTWAAFKLHRMFSILIIFNNLLFYKPLHKTFRQMYLPKAKHQEL